MHRDAVGVAQGCVPVDVHEGNAGVICGEGMVEGNILGPRGRRLRREADASASGDRVATMTVLVALLSELTSAANWPAQRRPQQSRG